MGSKKIQPPTSKKKEKKAVFFKKKIQIGISTSKFLSCEKKFSCQPQKCKLELCLSNGFQVWIYLYFLLLLKEVALKQTKQLLWCYCSVNNNLIKIFFTIFKITNDKTRLSSHNFSQKTNGWICFLFWPLGNLYYYRNT